MVYDDMIARATDLNSRAKELAEKYPGMVPFSRTQDSAHPYSVETAAYLDEVVTFTAEAVEIAGPHFDPTIEGNIKNATLYNIVHPLWVNNPILRYGHLCGTNPSWHKAIKAMAAICQ